MFCALSHLVILNVTDVLLADRNLLWNPAVYPIIATGTAPSASSLPTTVARVLTRVRDNNVPGVEKSQQCRKYFRQYSTFTTKIRYVRIWRHQSNLFLAPGAISTSVRPWLQPTSMGGRIIFLKGYKGFTYSHRRTGRHFTGGRGGKICPENNKLLWKQTICPETNFLSSMRLEPETSCKSDLHSWIRL